MGLKLYNSRPKSDHMIGLFLTPMAELKTCVASIGGGAIAGDIIFSLFNMLAMPVAAFGLGFVAFMSAVDIINDKMCNRAMRHGEIRVVTMRRPKIDV